MQYCMKMYESQVFLLVDTEVCFVNNTSVVLLN